MPTLDSEIACPDCGHSFELREAPNWNVCCGCGFLWGPGHKWHGSDENPPHHRDPSVDCDSPHSVRRYSREEALKLARENGNDSLDGVGVDLEES